MTDRSMTTFLLCVAAYLVLGVACAALLARLLRHRAPVERSLLARCAILWPLGLVGVPIVLAVRKLIVKWSLR